MTPSQLWAIPTATSPASAAATTSAATRPSPRRRAAPINTAVSIPASTSGSTEALSAAPPRVLRIRRHHVDDPRLPPAQVARVLVAITAGFMFQYALVGDVGAAMFRDGVRALATMRR
jgi:hypothetical protein